jgi:hypothetical protein
MKNKEEVYERNKIHESECKAWRQKAYRCHKGKDSRHSWIATSKVISAGSEHVTTLMCGDCFHQINVSDIHKVMEPIPSE